MQNPFARLFWKPSGWVASLDDLNPAHGLMAKHDLSTAVGSERRTLPVVELAGGKIIGDLRLVATSNDVVVGGMQAVADVDPSTHYLMRRRRLRLPKYRRGTAWLLGAAASDNYYHWLMESVPRWHLMQLAGYQHYDYVLLHSRPQAFQDELLDRIGVPIAKRLRCSKNYIHQFDRLIVPAMIPPARWQTEAWVCQWLRSLFPMEKPAGPEKIYLSRKLAQRRRLINETEIAAELMKLGFTSITPEQLSMADQVKLFSGVKFIVAPHGAGLTNLVFAPPGTRAVEFFHPDKRPPCYKNLAATCGHHYAAMTGTRTGSHAQSDEEAAFSIEISDLLAALSDCKAKQDGP